MPTRSWIYRFAMRKIGAPSTLLDPEVHFCNNLSRVVDSIGVNGKRKIVKPRVEQE